MKEHDTSQNSTSSPQKPMIPASLSRQQDLLDRFLPVSNAYWKSVSLGLSLLSIEGLGQKLIDDGSLPISECIPYTAADISRIGSSIEPGIGESRKAHPTGSHGKSGHTDASSQPNTQKLLVLVPSAWNSLQAILQEAKNPAFTQWLRSALDSLIQIPETSASHPEKRQDLVAITLKGAFGGIFALKSLEGECILYRKSNAPCTYQDQSYPGWIKVLWIGSVSSKG